MVYNKKYTSRKKVPNMKKLLSVFLVFLMLLSGVTIISSAEGELPFELTAPQNVYAKWLEGGDSPTTVQFAYSLTNEMMKLFKSGVI